MLKFKQCSNEEVLCNSCGKEKASLSIAVRSQKFWTVFKLCKSCQSNMVDGIEQTEQEEVICQ